VKKIRHSKLPITLESSDSLTPEMLESISLQMEYKGWSTWIDEYESWFEPYKPNKNQIEIFEEE
jgi:hypothetical protein|tara:strand:- start:394 stop:585 length:192 start_codon:yes stop_codon:yes gene_type:complete